MPAPLRLLVTGASGNVGTAMLRRIAETHPDWEVRGLSRRPPGDVAFPYDRVTWYAADLGTPECEPVLARAVEGADAVVHLAWRIQPSWNLETLQDVNLAGTRRVVDAARAAAVPHVVHASSIGTYAPVPRGRLPKPVTDESWPTSGIPTSAYSWQKAAVERYLDEVERDPDAPVIARLRPGLVLQPDAASEMGRYFLGRLSALTPLVLRLLPVVPLPDGLVANAVHGDDVGDAIVRILERSASGPFNLSADDIVTPDVVAAAFRARRVKVPYAVLRAVVDLSWRLHLQPTDAGWLDLARNIPLMDNGRARRVLGWAPRHSARQSLLDLLSAMGAARGTASPALAPRSVTGGRRTGGRRTDGRRTDEAS